MKTWDSPSDRPQRPDSLHHSFSIFMGALAFAALIIFAMVVPQ